jgi:hypothetical protein
MPSVLIIGATRGLGLALANLYASTPENTVFGTTRSATAPSNEKVSKNITWVKNIDLMDPGCGRSLANQLLMAGVGGGMVEGKEVVRGFDVVVCPILKFSFQNEGVKLTGILQIITAGYFATEDFVTGPKWEEEIKMYSSSPASLPLHPPLP